MGVTRVSSLLTQSCRGPTQRPICLSDSNTVAKPSGATSGIFPQSLYSSCSVFQTELRPSAVKAAGSMAILVSVYPETLHLRDTCNSGACWPAGGTPCAAQSDADSLQAANHDHPVMVRADGGGSALLRPHSGRRLGRPCGCPRGLTRLCSPVVSAPCARAFRRPELSADEPCRRPRCSTRWGGPCGSKVWD
jgi:hypothetical protein